MKNKFIYMMMTLVAAFGLSMTSCSDDETSMSRKVLASVSILECEGLNPADAMIMVTSDGDWVAETPDWVKVTPSSGSVGQTEVTITFDDNLRDGTLDTPRRANVLFKGRNLESIATVLIRQDGDKFRDPVEYTIESLETTPNETVVKISNLIAVNIGKENVLATDGTNYVYIKQPAIPLTVGQKFTVVGEKYAEADTKMPYVNGERVSAAGTGTVPTPQPLDINGILDTMNGTKFTYVSFNGAFDGSSVKVGNNASKVYFIDVPDAMDIKSLAGHLVEVKGYYAGAAAPVVNVIPTEIKDLGLNETIYWLEDFEWLEPWSAAGNGSLPAADIVGTDQANTEQPQITSAKCVIDGKTPAQELAARGYDFLRYTAGKVDGYTAGECIYIQRNYLKFGKTGFQGGIILPAMSELGSGITGATLSFDWYTQRQGSGVFDPTQIVVIITTGSDETHVTIPLLGLAEGSAAKWVRASVELGDVKIDNTTRITIRNVDSQLGSAKALRWHIDNIKVSKAL